MKKLVVTILSVLGCGAIYALPVGNPSDASLLCTGVFLEGNCGDPCAPGLSWCDAFSFRAGFYGDYVYNRHMALDDNSNRGEKAINHFEIYTNAGFLAFNLWNRFDVFATLGVSNLALQTNESAFFLSSGAPVLTALFECETVSDFSWSVGARGTLWECGRTSLGVEAQYFQTTQDIWRLAPEPIANIPSYPDNQLNVKYQEWQVGLGLSHRINVFIPYVAVKCSGVKFNADNARYTFLDPAIGIVTIQLFDLENDKSWGYAVGVSLIACDRISLTAEARFGDEKAVYANGQIRF